MSARSAARRYAKVLFEVVEKTADLSKAETDLNGFVALLEGNAELQQALASPVIPAAKKRTLVEALLSASGDVSGEVSRLLLMLADRDRLGAVRDVATDYSARLMAHRKIVQATIVTADTLPDGKRDALATALSAVAGATGATVQLQEAVDPAIMGGIVARVGSTVYDASVARQLEIMRQQLLDAV
ncbi:MAG: ATP synthase F1 subunit delta [Acidobacteria bacterium]|jgi:F-type H+-transporting ATPase subunit delta|nr:ATP synthase F1 subunit delta [Acidobacteriota bacterium]